MPLVVLKRAGRILMRFADQLENSSRADPKMLNAFKPGPRRGRGGQFADLNWTELSYAIGKVMLYFVCIMHGKRVKEGIPILGFTRVYFASGVILDIAAREGKSTNPISERCLSKPDDDPRLRATADRPIGSGF